MRLGCAGPSDPVPCKLCGMELLDSAGSHAMCCSKAESTNGHFEVTRQIFAGVQQCDPGAETEVAGLIPGTALRPADILTAGLGGGAVALDIGICSPDAQHAGADCVETMRSRKIAYYAPHTGALDRQTIQYFLLVFSAFGRPHPETTAYLRTLSKRISRRRGCSDSGAVYRGLQKAIAVEIWRRAAKQVISCWPGALEWQDT